MKKHFISIFIFIAYIVPLIKVMVFKDIPTIKIGQLMLNFGGTDASGHVNFVPFTTIVPYLLGYKGLIIAGVNLVGNIVPLVPIGFLLPFVYQNMTWKKSLACAVATGLAIEVMQTILRVGIFDIDDVILNALGVMIGYWAFIIITKWVRERKYINIFIAVVIIITAAAGAFYAIYPWGQPLVNPGVGAGEGEISQSGDLCGNTGGTGEIIGKGDNTITIKRQDGVVQTINLTAQTEIKNRAGLITESDLKIGDHVTIVTFDERMTATTILVCTNYPKSGI